MSGAEGFIGVLQQIADGKIPPRVVDARAAVDLITALRQEPIDSGGELWKIDKLIDELQRIRTSFGPTCVLVDQLSWGAVAMNRRAERETLIRDLQVALDRSMVTAISLGQAEEREVRRMMESPALTGVRELPEAKEWRHWADRLSEALRAALPWCRAALGPATVEARSQSPEAGVSATPAVSGPPARRADPDPAVVALLRRWGCATVADLDAKLARAARRADPGDAPPRTLRCSFCGKAKEAVRYFIGGPGAVHICNECVALCADIIANEKEREPEPTGAERKRQRRIVADVIDRFMGRTLPGGLSEQIVNALGAALPPTPRPAVVEGWQQATPIEVMPARTAQPVGPHEFRPGNPVWGGSAECCEWCAQPANAPCHQRGTS